MTRQAGAQLPAWAKGRPRQVVQAWQKRSDEGQQLLQQLPSYVQPAPAGQTDTYTVPKSEETLQAQWEVAKLDGTARKKMTLAAYKQQMQPTERSYTVCISSLTCTCGDCRTHNHVCKHLFAALHSSSRCLSTIDSPKLQAPAVTLDKAIVGAGSAGGAPPALLLQEVAAAHEAEEEAAQAAEAAAAADNPDELYGADEDEGEQTVAGRRGLQELLAKLHLIKTAAHDVHETAPQSFAAELAELLRLAGTMLTSLQQHRPDIATTMGTTGGEARQQQQRRRRSSTSDARRRQAGAGRGSAGAGGAGGADASAAGPSGTAGGSKRRRASDTGPEAEFGQPAVRGRPRMKAADKRVMPAADGEHPEPARMYAPGAAGGREDPDLQYSSESEASGREEGPAPAPPPPAPATAAAAAGGGARAPLQNFQAPAAAGRGKPQAQGGPLLPGRVPNVSWQAVSAIAAQQAPTYVTIQQQQTQLRHDERDELRRVAKNPSIAANLPTKLLSLVEQGSDGWRRARDGLVTASQLGARLGFRETSAAKALGVKYTDHSSAVQVYSSSATPLPDSPQLAWGRAHEPNSRLLLQQRLTSIPGFEHAHKFTLRETGLWVKHREGAVSVGASPDDLLDLNLRGSSSTYLVEYKSRFPFRAEKENGGYAVLTPAQRAPPAQLCPTHFAQLQLGMHVTGTKAALLLQYGVDTTFVWQVQASEAWCSSMLPVLDAFNAAYLGKGADLPANFGDKSSVAVQYRQLLELTKQLLADSNSVSKIAELPSIIG